MSIYKKINQVMKAVEYVRKDASVQGYKAVTHDNVVAAVRPAMVENGIISFQSLVESSHEQIGQTKNGTPQFMFSGTYDVTFVDIDDDSKLVVRVSAQAIDHSDKGPGKAMSYAYKYALLKTFCLETGENEESRQEVNKFRDEQKDMMRTQAISSVKHMIEKTESDIDVLLKHYGVESIDDMNQTQLSDVMAKLKAKQKGE